MRIQRVEAWTHTMRLAEPYTIAYEHVDTATNVFVRIVPDTGPVGLGCAAPDQAVTGETVAETLTLLQGPIAERLVGADPLRRVLAAVVERNGDRIAGIDDVAVGQQVAVGRDQKARARALVPAAASLHAQRHHAAARRLERAHHRARVRVEQGEIVGRGREVVAFHRPIQPWRNPSRTASARVAAPTLARI